MAEPTEAEGRMTTRCSICKQPCEKPEMIVVRDQDGNTVFHSGHPECAINAPSPVQRMTTRRDFLRLAAVATGALVLPDEQFVRRLFPVGITLPRTFRVANLPEWQHALKHARGGDTVHIVDTITGTTESPLVVPARPRGYGWITVSADPDKARQNPPPVIVKPDDPAQWLVTYNCIAPTEVPWAFRFIGPIRRMPFALP